MVKHQICESCRFFEQSSTRNQWKGQCRRYAPRPFSASQFYALELLRHIAQAQYAIAKVQPPDDEDDDINTEATEAPHWTSWPDVDAQDWCGEWMNRLSDY